MKEESQLEGVASPMSKGSMLYVTSDALSLDNGETPKVGDELAAVSEADTRARKRREIAAKGGRAGKLYTPRMVRKLLKCVSDGLNLKQAAVACGISETTLHGWKHEHPEFLQKLEETRERARQLALETIWAARGDDWRAAEAFLKYSFHQDYRSGNQVNVNQNTAVVVEKTMTEEERMKLIKQRERSQAKLNEPARVLPEPVIDAQVLPEPEQQPEQAQPEPEPERGFSSPPEGWHEQRALRAKEAAIMATKEEEQAERDRQLLRNKLEISQLFGSDD
jgi:hypothetical protein